MTIEDVRNAIWRKDMRTIEAAFDALANWPQEGPMDGAGDVDALMLLLFQVATALQNDVYFMPARTCDLIQHAAGKIVFAYKDGVKAVMDHREFWRAAFRSAAIQLKSSAEVQSIRHSG